MMKSLSILLLLGTLTALVIGGLFAVSPALAENSPQDTVDQAFVDSPAAATVANEAAPLAPTTGSEPIQLELAANSASDPGQVMGSVFSIDIEKDLASAPAIEAPAAEFAASTQDEQSAPQTAISLESFVNSVADGSSNVVGIYVDNTLAWEVGGQPSDNPGYVTNNANEVTRFGLAFDYGSQGFLAHNYLAGAGFFSLSSGQTITLVFGDGRTQDYQVQTVRRFQALQPNSTQSDFVDLDTGANLSASDLFYQIYNSDNPVVLQTCIENEGISTWGRLFVIAVPVG